MKFYTGIIMSIFLVIAFSCKKQTNIPEPTPTHTNNQPMADIHANPIIGGTFTIFSFDASNCTDEEDSIEKLKVRWDWNSDNNWDTPFSTNKIAEHSFDQHGSHTIQVEVKDTDGKTNFTTFRIEIDTNTYVNMGNPCPGLESFEYEGQSYNTVLIGDQCWMKENLNIGEMIANQDASDNGVIEKHCYENDPANCEKYGGLYSWDEIMQYQTEEGVQGICPEGWHIPTDEEYRLMEVRVDSRGKVGNEYFTKNNHVLYSYTYHGYDAFSRLLSNAPDEWTDLTISPSNKSGFSLKGAGSGNSNDFYYKNTATYLWTSSQAAPTIPIVHAFESTANTFFAYSLSKYRFGSIRCLRDE